MSENPGPSTGAQTPDYDPTLDISSELFDPLKAIRMRIKPPDPKAKVFDNLKILEARIKLLGSLDKDLSTHQVVRPVSKKQPSLTSQVKDLKTLTTSVRRFLPHQEPVAKPRKAAKNVLTRMEDKDLLAGPLGVLHKFMQEKTRVRIYTRKEHGVRGYVTGFVEVFDCHFNIGLRDAFEVYKRRKYAFSENKIGLLGEPKDCTALLRRMGIDLPVVKKAQSLNLLISDVFASTDGYHFYKTTTSADNDYEEYYREIESTTEEPHIHPLPERMDLITIVWYFSTFIALIAFFVYMACADKCHRRKPTVNARPVTPAPSYKNFAPPSYDTAIKKMKTARVFIVPVHGERNVFDSPQGRDVDVEATVDSRATASHL